jgi:hypothetical protein
LLEAVGDGASFPAAAPDEEHAALLRRHARTGRPPGDTSFIARLERDLGRRLCCGQLGPGRKQADGSLA